MKKINYLTLALAIILAFLSIKLMTSDALMEFAVEEAKNGDFRPALIWLVFTGTVGLLSANLSIWVFTQPKTKEFLGLNS